jgi:hypothetical protein
MKGKVSIRLKGQLDGNWKDWFDGMEIIYDLEDTLLEGKIKDEAHIHGILNKIRDLNLVLISINPTEK